MTLRRILIALSLCLSPAVCSADINTGLIDYWSFDGRNVNWATNTATDLSGANNNGTLISMSTTTAATAGKKGQALKFDGVNDYIDGSGYSSMQTFTVSAWIRAGQTSTTFDGLVDWSDSSNRRYGIGLDQTGDPVLIYLNASSLNRRREATGVNLDDFKWHHIVGIFDGNNAIMYVDGNPVTLGGEINDLSSATNATDLRIGQHTAGSFFFNGEIDEIRIYDRALSTDDVRQLYTFGSANISVTSSQNRLGFGNNNLVGHWTFDGRNVNWSTNSVTDLSGNGNTGSLISMSTTSSPATGRIGQALDFDGANDYVTMGNVLDFTTEDITISLWAKPNNSSQNASFVAKRDNSAPYKQYNFGTGSIDSGGNITASKKISIFFHNGGTLSNSNSQAYRTTDDVIDGNWHHYVALRRNGVVEIYVDGVSRSLTTIYSAGNVNVSNTAEFRIANGNSAIYLDSAIDDVRIYSKALTANEVQQLYNLGSVKISKAPRVDPSDNLMRGLIGHWTLDGNKINWRTNTATDSSPTLNNATFVNISTTSDIRTGKIGQALYFNGVSSYVEIPRAAATVSGAITHAIWFKPGEFTDTRPLVGNINGQTGSDGQAITYKNAGASENVSCPGLTATLTFRSLQQNWHHLVCSYDGTNVSIYLDGSFVTSGASTYTTATENNLKMGSHNGASTSFYKGLLDDFRIYNRALSANEVKQLYQLGVSKRR